MDIVQEQLPSNMQCWFCEKEKLVSKNPTRVYRDYENGFYARNEPEYTKECHTYSIRNPETSTDHIFVVGEDGCIIDDGEFVCMECIKETEWFTTTGFLETFENSLSICKSPVEETFENSNIIQESDNETLNDTMDILEDYISKTSIFEHDVLPSEMKCIHCHLTKPVTRNPTYIRRTESGSMYAENEADHDDLKYKFYSRGHYSRKIEPFYVRKGQCVIDDSSLVCADCVQSLDGFKYSPYSGYISMFCLVCYKERYLTENPVCINKNDAIIVVENQEEPGVPCYEYSFELDDNIVVCYVPKDECIFDGSIVCKECVREKGTYLSTGY